MSLIDSIPLLLFSLFNVLEVIETFGVITLLADAVGDIDESSESLVEASVVLVEHL